MVATMRRRVRPVNVAHLQAIFDHRETGVTFVRSPDPLGSYPVRVTDRLEIWAERVPDRIFLAQRNRYGRLATNHLCRNMAEGAADCRWTPWFRPLP